MKLKNVPGLFALQTDFNSVSRWRESWLIKLNPNKCKHTRVSLKPNDKPCYYHDGNSLEKVSSYKYVGIQLNSKLSWKPQHTTSRANCMMGYNKRNFSLEPVSLKLSLYKTLIGPNLEYASSIWDPGQDTLVMQVESIQNRSASFLLSNYHRSASVT